jgi:fatty acid desaturase
MAGRAAGAGRDESEPRPAAVTFVTTEHFTLQGARASTIAEATGRATMFLGAVSGGLVALGLIATAAGVRTPFYAFALILLPTLALLGLATFNRALQSGIEDLGYAHRIARLRGYYFRHALELDGYLLSVPPAGRLRLQGIGGGRAQKFFTAAAMVGLVTAVLAGSAAGLLAAVASGHSLIAALIAGVLVAVVVFAALIRFQVSAWKQAAALLPDDQ